MKKFALFNLTRPKVTLEEFKCRNEGVFVSGRRSNGKPLQKRARMGSMDGELIDLTLKDQNNSLSTLHSWTRGLRCGEQLMDLYMIRNLDWQITIDPVPMEEPHEQKYPSLSVTLDVSFVKWIHKLVPLVLAQLIQGYFETERSLEIVCHKSTKRNGFDILTCCVLESGRTLGQIRLAQVLQEGP